MLCTPWVDADTLECVPDLDPAPDPADLQRYALIASQLLYNATGRRWNGVCLDSLTNCHGACDCACGHLRCRGPQTPDRHAIHLPGRPVVAVDTLTVNGVAITGDVEVDDGRWLVLPAGVDPGLGWSTTYRYGSAPPEYLAHAAELLTCAIARDATPSTCDIGDNVTQIVREGVTYTLDAQAAPADSAAAAQSFGLADVNRAVNSANRPNPARARVITVDALECPPHRRTVTMTIGAALTP